MGNKGLGFQAKGALKWICWLTKCLTRCSALAGSNIQPHTSFSAFSFLLSISQMQSQKDNDMQ